MVDRDVGVSKAGPTIYAIRESEPIIARAREFAGERLTRRRQVRVQGNARRATMHAIKHCEVVRNASFELHQNHADLDHQRVFLSVARLAERLGRESAPRSISTRGCAGCMRPTPASTRSSRWAWSCPGPSRTSSRRCRIAAEESVPILPRGAATSLSGQTIGPAIVIDFSKYLNRIGIVDRDAMTVRVEPGVVLDQLNAHLKPLGLMFGPDVSTSDRATIGGMIGNNSAGARSLRYGKTVDHVRSRRRRPGRRHDGHASARSRRTSSTRSARGPIRSARSIAWSATPWPRTEPAIRERFPADPPPGQRLQPRRVRARPAGPARRAGPTSPGSSTWRG